MIKMIICSILGHDYLCILHNCIIHDRKVDTIYTCVVRCIRCYCPLHYNIHYSKNCGYKPMALNAEEDINE